MPTRSAAGPPPRTCSRRAPAAPRTRPAAANEAGGVTADVVLPGTPNFLAKYVNGADVGSSGVFEAADGAVGMGTTTPFDRLHVRYDNNTGDFTGLAVQNMNGGALAYSGMLFYDHTNALTQFQGYNNSTHEYRINNIARVSPGGAFNGSINFMIGGISRFYVSPTTVGIGTTSPSPSANLDVSNAISGSGTTNVNVTTYSANPFGPNLIGKKARGTPGAPTAVLNNDALLDLSANGYGATGFAGVNSASISMRASENWTNTAQGSIMNFSTTANGTTAPTTRMTIGANGNVGIGVFGAQASLEVSNANGASGAGTMLASTFTNAGSSQFVGRRARGTGIAPTAVQSGDNLVGFLGQGYGTTGFSSGPRGGMFVSAAENWTDAAQGTRLHFLTTATGTNTQQTRMTIAANGDIGIGTTTPSATVEAVRDGDVAVVGATSYGDGCCAGFVARMARGTAAAPAAVQLGDPLALFPGDGYGATDFSSEAGGMVIIAAENWTDTAQGTAVAFTTTPLGSTEDAAHMVIMPDGNVGIGTFTDDHRRLPTSCRYSATSGLARPAPTAASRISPAPASPARCSSDRRFKKDITPFGHVLDQLTALQPVHYFWRAAEFPDSALRRRPRLRPDRAGRRAGAARARRHQRRRLQGGGLQRAAAAHHPGRQGTQGGERRARSSASPRSTH